MVQDLEGYESIMVLSFALIQPLELREGICNSHPFLTVEAECDGSTEVSFPFIGFISGSVRILKVSSLSHGKTF
jgi:hypothetical protein